MKQKHQVIKPTPVTRQKTSLVKNWYLLFCLADASHCQPLCSAPRTRMKEGEMMWNPFGNQGWLLGSSSTLCPQRGVQSQGVSSPSFMGRWSSCRVGCWRRDQWYYPWCVNRQRSGRANPSIHPACCYFCSSAVVMSCSALKAKLSFLLQIVSKPFLRFC